MNDKLKDSLQELSGLKEPERDLWPDLERSLPDKRTANIRQFPFPLSMAAGAAIMLMGLLLGLNISGSRQDRGGYYPDVRTLAKEYNIVRPASFSHIREDSTLPAESIDLIEDQLMSMEKTAAVLINLLKENPDDDRIYEETLRLYRRMYQILQSLGDYARESVPPREI